MRFVKPQHRKESACKCRCCKHMCLQSPCFPTPEEVERLIAMGYRDKLMGSIWIDPETYQPQYGTMDMYQLVAPVQTKTGCVFLENGLCTLHEKGLKPLEGRLASHDLPDNGLRRWVSEKWICQKGKELLQEFDTSVADHVRELASLAVRRE